MNILRGALTGVALTAFAVMPAKAQDIGGAVKSDMPEIGRAHV